MAGLFPAHASLESSLCGLHMDEGKVQSAVELASVNACVQLVQKLGVRIHLPFNLQKQALLRRVQMHLESGCFLLLPHSTHTEEEEACSPSSNLVRQAVVLGTPEDMQTLLQTGWLFSPETIPQRWLKG